MHSEPEPEPLQVLLQVLLQLVLLLVLVLQQQLTPQPVYLLLARCRCPLRNIASPADLPVGRLNHQSLVELLAVEQQEAGQQAGPLLAVPLAAVQQEEGPPLAVQEVVLALPLVPLVVERTTGNRTFVRSLPTLRPWARPSPATAGTGRIAWRTQRRGQRVPQPWGRRT